MKFENPHASVIDDIESRVDSVVSENEALKARLESQALLSVEARGLANRKTSGLASAEEAASATKAIATRVYERLTPTEQAAYNIDDLCKFFQRHDYSMALANVGTNSLALDGFINRVLADLDGELLAKDRQAARKYLLEVWSYGDQVVGSRCHEDGKLITQPIKLLNFSAVHAHKLKRYSHCLTGLSSAKTATLGLHDVEWLSLAFPVKGMWKATEKPTSIGGYDHHNLDYSMENFVLIYVSTNANDTIKGVAVTDVASCMHLRVHDVDRNYTPDNKLGLYPRLFGSRRVATEYAETLIGKTLAINPTTTAIDLLD